MDPPQLSEMAGQAAEIRATLLQILLGDRKHMDNEVVREDSDSTERRSWTAAEAAHPALGLGSTEPLSRKPRGSQAPAVSETVVTPAPRFDGSGERIDASSLVMSTESEQDLDGIVELSSTMLVEENDSGEVEMLSDDLIEEVTEDVELLDASDVIEEVDSGLLSYVEARGEIIDKPHPAPAPIEGSSVSLAALHETLHNQAVDSGMATYSTGVPVHSLDRDSTGKTQQIQRPTPASSVWTIRNILMAMVFLAGIGAGVFFGRPGSSSAKAAPGTSRAAVIIPEDASAKPLAAQANNVPVVAPLVESTEDPQAGEDPQLTDPALAVGDLATEEGDLARAGDLALGEGDPALGEGDPAQRAELPTVETLADSSEEVAEKTPKETLAESKVEVRPLEVAAPTKPKVRTPSKPARRARSNDVDDIAPKSFGSGDPGVLMLGAKPPCDIFIDGKKTGLKTPQRVLRLPPGRHKITLINREHKLRDSFRVSIQSGKKTRIIRDMTSKIR